MYYTMYNKYIIALNDVGLRGYLNPMDGLVYLNEGKCKVEGYEDVIAYDFSTNRDKVIELLSKDLPITLLKTTFKENDGLCYDIQYMIALTDDIEDFDNAISLDDIR